MERTDKNVTALPHQLIMQERHLVELTGVSDVGNFDENSVSVCTSLGELTIRGSGLHIRQLDLASGSLAVEGRIDSLLYAELQRVGGFFGRLFR